jgi:hypothetical protein
MNITELDQIFVNLRNLRQCPAGGFYCWDSGIQDACFSLLACRRTYVALTISRKRCGQSLQSKQPSFRVLKRAKLSEFAVVLGEMLPWIRAKLEDIEIGNALSRQRAT